MRFTLSSVVLCFVIVAVTVTAVELPDNPWWKNILIYQVYPRSFMDSDGDGIGDLNGITSRLEHIRETGATAFWLSPINKSPQKDFGYDISDFTAIDPQFGTIDDFRALMKRAKSLGLKVLMDLVPNHSSDQHEWFKKSVRRVKPYDDYYIWRDGKMVDGVRSPPSNWLSSFGGSSWEWNEERGQYYYHQFATAQPDLNYRNPALKKEMEKVLLFWLEQGVDGFRIDAVVHLFEDEQMRDEPLSRRPGFNSDEYEYLDHIYTRDLDETYGVIAEWRKLMNDFAREHKTQAKYGILEAGNVLSLNMKYYDSGMDPFNFMFTLDIHKDTPPEEYVQRIQELLANIPYGQLPNWVIGNHDQPRVATRFGRADQMSMLALMLPGLTVIYNGDEIGMVDRPLSWEETVDPAGCNAGPEKYNQRSRDPARTPFQWDNTTNAGFSFGRKTWLPVHENYHHLNLLDQQQAPISHFKTFKRMIRLKQSELVQTGFTEISTSLDGQVLGLVRRLPHRSPLVLLINFSEDMIFLDLVEWMHLPERLNIYATNVESNLRLGATVFTENFLLPAAASVVLAGDDLDV
ncbi:maltase 1-like [Trichogramma pretiosum]|uniref:maltase 1-like n=1 Tax=Trichogramma pretiosum TaxID=7493 RepID=UPI000C71AFE4|nr:maltase 1-like [Trichogramma pretiosum]